jgi:hypothetical protein
MKAFEEREEKAIFGRNLMGGFWSARDYMGFMRTFVYGDHHVVLDKYTIVEPDRNRVIYNWLQYYSVEAIAREFEKNGFRVEVLFSNVTGDAYHEDSPEIAVIAKKA